MRCKSTPLWQSHARCLSDARSLDPAMRRALVVLLALAGGRALHAPMCRNPYGIVMPYGVPRPSSWVGVAIVPTSSCAVMVRSVCGAACSRQSRGNRPGAVVWPGHKVRHKVLLRFWGVGGLEGVFGVWVGMLPCVSLSRFRSTPVGERGIYGLQKKKTLILTCHMRCGI